MLETLLSKLRCFPFIHITLLLLLLLLLPPGSAVLITHCFVSKLYPHIGQVELSQSLQIPQPVRSHTLYYQLIKLLYVHPFFL